MKFHAAWRERGARTLHGDCDAIIINRNQHKSCNVTVTLDGVVVAASHSFLSAFSSSSPVSLDSLESCL